MATHSLLFVDDEPNILKALQRIFMDNGYQLYTATSGEKALEILKTQPISLIISDQKMPNMTGSEFLEKVNQQYPETIRILLTGHSDIKSTIDAINNGRIYRYISKPWNDEDLKVTILKALEQYELIQENKRLLKITQRQNEKLLDTNNLLEEKVQQRTEELNKLYLELKQNFLEFIRVFINLISTFDNQIGEHCKRVTVIAKLIGQKLDLKESDLEQLEIAALLHDLGLIGIPKHIHERHFYLLTNQEQDMYKQHTSIGQSMISGVKTLTNVGRIIRNHHEQYDGQGYPDALKGEDIPLLARIIRVADEYDHLKQTTVGNKPLSNQKCMDYLNKYRGNILDPNVVDYFILGLRELQNNVRKEAEVMFLSISYLKSGMKLSRTIKTKNEVAIMQANTILQQEEIDTLLSYKQMNALVDKIYVYKS